MTDDLVERARQIVIEHGTLPTDAVKVGLFDQHETMRCTAAALRATTNDAQVERLMEAARDVVKAYPVAAGTCKDIHGDQEPGYGAIKRLAAALSPPSGEPVVGLPDIGTDPMKQPGKRDLSAAEERLKQAYEKQQHGVPDQTALVWRVDLGDLRRELLRLRTLADRKPTPTDTADRRETIITDVVEEAEQACRYVAKHNVCNMDAGEYRDGFEAACEVCEKTIAAHVKRHDGRIAASLISSPPTVGEGFREARDAWAKVLNGMKLFGMESSAIETVDDFFASSPNPGEVE